MDKKNLSYPYPPGPLNFDERILEPSEAFRNEVKGVLGSILVFIVTYFFLVVAATALAGLCAWAGVWVIIAVKNLWGILFGVGLIGLGIMVVFFLFKFVFKRSTTDRSNMIEVNRKQQPLLFDFLKRLAKETQTPFPKKVFLSPEANAYVFYDSSFWSMFLPVRKNLNIGLALVNTLNVTELKAVIAHEFGHFSQRSMKLGSYVYNVNRILHDMLYENDGYESTLESWGNVSNVFAFFAELTRVIVNIIQDILRALYGKINVRYMALSRQMEFHADAVAASVSGSFSLVNALYKLDVADSCYRNVIGVYNGWVQDSRKSRNIYPQHSIVIKDYANVQGLPLDENGLVEVSADDFKKYNKKRVVIKDQWASHPSTEDREKHLISLNLESSTLNDPAWSLFVDREGLQEEMTENLYSNVTFAKEPQVVNDETFAVLFTSQVEKYRFNKGYKGFYDGREITAFDPEAIAQQPSVASSLGDILSEQTLSLPFLIDGLKSDIEVLETLQPKSSGIKTFDFDGKRYDREDAIDLIAKLKRELKEATAAIEEADKEMFRLYWNKARARGIEEEVIEMYRTMISLVGKAEKDLKHVNSMIREASQLFSEHVTKDMASAVTNNMVRERVEIKQLMKGMLQDSTYAPYYSEDERNTLLRFIDDVRPYFFNVGFDSEAINLYMDSLFIYGRIISERSFEQKKLTLERQLDVILGQLEYV